jgi:manganese transport protein
MAGQMIMQGFVRFEMPVWLRRLITMAPAFVVVAIGTDPTHALIMSLVVLSIALPVPMLALVHFTSRRDIMGDYASTRLVGSLAKAGVAVVLVLNVILLAEAAGISLTSFLG